MGEYPRTARHCQQCGRAYIYEPEESDFEITRRKHAWLKWHYCSAWCSRYATGETENEYSGEDVLGFLEERCSTLYGWVRKQIFVDSVYWYGQEYRDKNPFRFVNQFFDSVSKSLFLTTEEEALLLSRMHQSVNDIHHRDKTWTRTTHAN